MKTIRDYWLITLFVRRVVKQNVRLRKRVRKSESEKASRDRLHKRTLQGELKWRDAEIARLEELVSEERLRGRIAEMQWRDRLLETVGRIGFSHMDSPTLERIHNLEMKNPSITGQATADKDEYDEYGLNPQERMIFDDMRRNHMSMGEQAGVSPKRREELWEENLDDILNEVRRQSQGF